MSSPRVSVLLPVYNGAEFLNGALASLRRQTFDNYEIIAIDDGSTDASGEMLKVAAQADPRIRVITNDTNIGLAASLNKAIGAARGELFARLDADDEAAPERLAKQVAEFDLNPSLILLGSNVNVIDAAGKRLWLSNYPRDDAFIRCTCLLENPFAHPTVMLRAEPVRRQRLLYDESFETAQDWEFWTRLLAFGRGKNMPEPLVRRRIHAQTISTKRRENQIKNSLRIMENYVGAVVGRDAWNREKFMAIIEGFLAGRDDADRNGVSRILACSYVLDLLKLWRARRPDMYVRRYEAQVLWRVMRMSFVPPLPPGVLKLLLRLLRDFPTFIPELAVKTIFSSVVLWFWDVARSERA